MSERDLIIQQLQPMSELVCHILAHVANAMERDRGKTTKTY